MTDMRRAKRHGAPCRRRFPVDGPKEELDSPRMKVWDTEWTSTEERTLHVHTRDTVLVFIDGGSIRTRMSDGSEQLTMYTPEDVVFVPEGTVHS